MIYNFFQILKVANSDEPDQTPRSVSSDLVLHCLPMSCKKDTRLILVNVYVSGNRFLKQFVVFFEWPLKAGFIHNKCYKSRRSRNWDHYLGLC